MTGGDGHVLVAQLAHRIAMSDRLLLPELGEVGDGDRTDALGKLAHCPVAGLGVLHALGDEVVNGEVLGVDDRLAGGYGLGGGCTRDGGCCGRHPGRLRNANRLGAGRGYDLDWLGSRRNVAAIEVGKEIV